MYTASNIAKGYYNKISKNHFLERVPLSKQILWTPYASFYMKKYSCFQKPFSAIIEEFVEHGLTIKWVKDYTTDTYKIKDKMTEDLKLEHIQGIFEICMGFYLIAFIIFLLEIFIGKFMVRYRANGSYYRRWW